MHYKSNNNDVVIGAGFSEIVNTNQAMIRVFSGSYKDKQVVPDERGPEAMVGKLYCKIEISLGKVRKMP